MARIDDVKRENLTRAPATVYDEIHALAAANDA